MTAPESKGPKPKKRRRDEPGPALQSLRLNPDQIPNNATEPLIVAIGLDGPAPPGGVNVQVDIFKAGPDAIPGQTFGPGIPVFVGEGETTGSKAVPPPSLPVAPGSFYDFRFEARFGDVSLTALLRVVGF